MERYGQTTHKSTKQTVRKIATGKSNGLSLSRIHIEMCIRDRVTLLDGTQEPERLICRAAYLARGQQMPELTQREQTELLRALLQGNRKRELEQASFTLLYGGMSLAALTHLTRHRMQSLAAPDLLANARYDRYVLPESVREAGLQARYCEAFSLAGEAAGKLASMNAGTDALCYLLVSGLRVPVVDVYKSQSQDWKSRHNTRGTTHRNTRCVPSLRCYCQRTPPCTAGTR